MFERSQKDIPELIKKRIYEQYKIPDTLHKYQKKRKTNHADELNTMSTTTSTLAKKKKTSRSMIQPKQSTPKKTEIIHTSHTKRTRKQKLLCKPSKEKRCRSPPTNSR
jgi:hypothetical protein